MLITEQFRFRDSTGVLIACVGCGILIASGLFIPYLNIAAFIIAALCIGSLNEEDEICFLSFLVMFAPIFKLNLYSFTLFNGLIVIGIIKGIARGNLQSRFFAIFSFFSIYVVLFGFSNDIKDCISFLCYLLYAALIFHPKYNEYNLHKIVSFTTLGIVFTSVISLNRNRIPRLASYLNDATIKLAQGVYYNRFAGLETNPNYYTMMISICLAVLVLLFIQGKTKWLDYVWMGVLCIFGLMSVSNSFLVSLVIVGALFLGTRSVPVNKKIFGVILFSIIGVLVISNLDQDTITTLLFRLDSSAASGNASELTTGRSTLWMRYIYYIFGDFFVLLFGKGIGAEALGVGASHNYYLDILYHLGIIGGCMYIGCLKRVFNTRPFRYRKPSLYQYIPLLVFLVRAFARNLILSEQLMFMLILCTLSVCDGNICHSVETETD